jgi:hypothetical protein
MAMKRGIQHIAIYAAEIDTTPDNAEGQMNFPRPNASHKRQADVVMPKNLGEIDPTPAEDIERRAWGARFKLS